jgi:hypothetical protein
MKKQIKHIIESVFNTFIERVLTAYPELTTKCSKETMLSMWKNVCKKKKIKKKQMTGYNLFVKEHHHHIAKQCGSHASFGEVSKSVGKAWTLLSNDEKKRFSRRAFLRHEHESNELWKYYFDKPLKYVYHIAENWLEEYDDVILTPDMSKEEVIALLIQYKDIPDTQPSGEDNDVLVEKDHASTIPVEVHPFYHELRKQSDDYVKKLFIHNFQEKTDGLDSHTMIKKLVRQFDTLDTTILENYVVPSK